MGAGAGVRELLGAEDNTRRVDVAVVVVGRVEVYGVRLWVAGLV